MKQQEDGMRSDESFRFRQLIVLLPVICLSFVNGILLTVQLLPMLSMEAQQIHFIRLCRAIAPVPGAVLLSFLSELRGRKLAFIILFTLSILTSILAAFPLHHIIICAIGLVLQDVVRGGSASITCLAISEYCSPNHRFAFLIANQAISIIGINLLFDADILDIDSIYIQVFGGVLGAVCLGVVCVWWPESPYWLCGKGRVEEGRQAFLWLRGGGSQGELDSLCSERRRPGPPRLFWVSLIIAILTVSMSIIADCQQIVFLYTVGPMRYFQNNPLSTGCILACLCISTWATELCSASFRFTITPLNKMQKLKLLGN